MRHLTITLLFALLFLPLACSPAKDSGQQRPAETVTAPLSRSTEFGSLGYYKIGEFEAQVPFYIDGDLMVYWLLSGYPGKPFGPASALVMRLPHSGSTLFDSGVSVTSDSLEINPAQLDSKGRTFRFHYGVSGKPLMEQLSAGGKSYQPEAGRVFLIDLTADPPIVTQVRTDLTDVSVARPGGSPGMDELKAAVEKLASKDKAIRDFLASIEKK
jgi:hypothetical protein